MTIFHAPKVSESPYSTIENNPLLDSFCRFIIPAIEDEQDRIRLRSICDLSKSDYKCKILWESSFSEVLFSYSIEDYKKLIELLNNNRQKFLSGSQISSVILSKINDYFMSKSAEYIIEGKFAEIRGVLDMVEQGTNLITRLFNKDFILQEKNLLDFLSYIKQIVDQKAYQEA